MSTPSTTPLPTSGVFPVSNLSTPSFEQTSSTQQSVLILGQPALAFVQVASSFGQPGQVVLLGQPALAIIGQQLEAGIGSDTQPIDSISTMDKPKDAWSCTKANATHPVNEDSHIETLLPKLRRSDYYTKPTIEELAAKEQEEPGYCGCIKDFVVGRHGVGSIRFLDETDIRHVDLDSLIQFKPGGVSMQDLPDLPGDVWFNGTAEITYLCPERYSHEEMRRHDTRSRLIKTVERFKKQLKDEGLEFVSYDPINGEWRYRVKYFSGCGDIVFKFKVKKVGLARRIKKLMRKIKKMI